jgi:hypothetical protein
MSVGMTPMKTPFTSTGMVVVSLVMLLSYTSSITLLTIIHIEVEGKPMRT